MRALLLVVGAFKLSILLDVYTITAKRSLSKPF
jgi:hypothetical protein